MDHKEPETAIQTQDTNEKTLTETIVSISCFKTPE